MRAFFGEGLSRIHLDELNCNGSESNLLECAANELGDHNCAHIEDAGVICTRMYRLLGAECQIFHSLKLFSPMCMHAPKGIVLASLAQSLVP